MDLFRGLGVDARLGAVPGEYCPGAHSVNARGTEKLVGTAQRMVPGAWLFSSLVVVGDEDRLRPVSREVPGLDVDTVEAAVVDAYRAEAPATPLPVDGSLLAMARSVVEQHRVGSGRPS